MWIHPAPDRAVADAANVTSGWKIMKLALEIWALIR
jgi:hypothetical protein